MHPKPASHQAWFTPKEKTHIGTHRGRIGGDGDELAWVEVDFPLVSKQGGVRAFLSIGVGLIPSTTEDNHFRAGDASCVSVPRCGGLSVDIDQDLRPHACRRIEFPQLGAVVVRISRGGGISRSQKRAGLELR